MPDEEVGEEELAVWDFYCARGHMTTATLKNGYPKCSNSGCHLQTNKAVLAGSGVTIPKITIAAHARTFAEHQLHKKKS